MSVWSKEELEEMCGDDIVEQLTFLSGCHQHELCNGNPSGWIIPDEVLRRLAEFIVEECVNLMENQREHYYSKVLGQQSAEHYDRVISKGDAFDEAANIIRKHFGVE